jgi:hypothetical protein
LSRPNRSAKVTVMDGGPAVLNVPRRSFVLVAGIPGAGKSSMLARRPIAARGAVVLDSDPIREWLRAKLPDGTPYRWYRGLVHLWHRVQIVLAVLSTLGPVVVHMPATGAFSRVALVSLAMLAWRRPYLVWVHAEPAEARRGQRARGRVLRRSCFERHARLGAAFVAGLRAGHQPRGWHRVILLDRRRARYGLVLDTEPAEGSVGQRSGELPAGSTGQPPRELPTRPAAGEVDAPAERAAG